MITDTLERWRRYAATPVWEKAFDFLSSLDANSTEGKTLLQGDDLFAIVMSYDTRERSAAMLESHRKYVDIQAALKEAEGIDWFPRDRLEIKIPYDAEKDAMFYHRPEGAAPAHLEMKPGHFVILYPEDAHMCQLIVDGAVRTIKKVVVKVRLDLVKDSL